MKRVTQFMTWVPVLCFPTLLFCGGGGASPVVASPDDASSSGKDTGVSMNGDGGGTISHPDGATTPRDGGGAVPHDTSAPPSDAGVVSSDSSFSGNVCPTGLTCGTLDPVVVAGGASSGVLEVPFNNTNGQHYYCFPAPGSGIVANGLLFIHLVGTGSDPALDHQMELEACTLGFAAIGPMYENHDQVTGTCEAFGAAADACYTEVHEAVVYGNSYSLPNDAGTPASYTPNDSLVHRTATLLSYLAAKESAFPGWQTFTSEFAAKNAGHIVLAGHSQGSGHSLYWSHRLAPTREIMLSGPPDRVHKTGGATATPTWISNFASDAGLAPSQLYGFNNVADNVVDIGWAMSNDDALGMASAQCAFDESLASSCHRVIIDAGCSSLPGAGNSAHGSTEVLDFGPAPACARGANGHNNANAWQYLLGK